MIKLIINGAFGQMGRTLIRMVQAREEEFTILAGTDAYGAGESEGVQVFASLADAPQDADVVIDFSRPEAIPQLVEYGLKNNARLVVCTTGLSEQENRMLDHAAEKIPVFQSGNMALGVNLQMELLKTTAGTLGDGFDVEIIEKHHNRKVDAPSGTALMLAEVIRAQYPGGREYVFGRHGRDAKRAPKEIGIHAVRGGTVVGEHQVGFYGQDETITITHQAFSKQVFGVGALRAAKYLMQKGPGRYSMRDVVTEHDVLSHVYTEEAQAVITLSRLPNTPGVMHAIFSAVAEAGTFVDMISTTTPEGKTAHVSFSVPREGMAAAINALQALRGTYEGMEVFAQDNLTKVTVEGPGMALRHGVAAELFGMLSGAGVGIELVTTSETKISCCIKNADVAVALKAITEEFKV